MKKAVFLDRDGTINVDKDYLYKIEDFEYLPGVVEGLKCLQQLGYILIVVTNQSGIARGYYKEEDYCAIDKWMKADLLEKGVEITASYFCPHLPGAPVKEYDKDCDCRKPGLGLFHKAIEDWDIDPDESIAIGDKLRDLAICKDTGCKGILMTKKDIDHSEDIIKVNDWKELIDHIDCEQNK